jgi:hypothetical protein
MDNDMIIDEGGDLKIPPAIRGALVQFTAFNVSATGMYYRDGYNNTNWNQYSQLLLRNPAKETLFSDHFNLLARNGWHLFTGRTYLILVGLSPINKSAYFNYVTQDSSDVT